MSNSLNSRSRASFTTLPTELKTKILSMACTHDDTIMPQQTMPGSSKYSFETANSFPRAIGYCQTLTRKDGALPSELSALDISRASKEIHGIVDGDKIFYAKNQLEFSNTPSLLNYLIALKPDVRNALRSIKVRYDYHGIPAAAFIMLAVCHRLDHLTLDISGMKNFFVPGLTHFSQAPGYEQLISLKGLKSVELAYASNNWTLIDDILERIPAAWISQDRAESERAVLRFIQQIEKNINEFTSQPRSGSRLINARGMGFAMQQAGVNTWGDTIDSALIPPGQVNTSLSNTMIVHVAHGNNASLNLMAQTKLSEQEQWAEIDGTNRASWDI